MCNTVCRVVELKGVMGTRITGKGLDLLTMSAAAATSSSVRGNYSDQAMETLIELSTRGGEDSPETIHYDNETNESSFRFNVKHDLFLDYPIELTQLTAIFCVIFFLMGIPGNLITIIALARCKKVRFIASI